MDEKKDLDNTLQNIEICNDTNKYECNFESATNAITSLNEMTFLQTLEKMHIETQNKLDQIILHVQEEINSEKSKRLVAEKKLHTIEEMLEKFIKN
jgi:hypothetical protein